MASVPGTQSKPARNTHAGPGKAPADPAKDAQDLHFRLDEHERQLHEMGKTLTPEAVAGVVHGAVAALHVSMQAQTEKLLTAVREDVQTDKSVVAAIATLVTEMRELTAALRALATARV